MSVQILVVATTVPWPEVTGARMRLANVLRGLGRAGELDLFVMGGPRPTDLPAMPVAPPVRRMEVVWAPRPGRTTRALTLFPLRATLAGDALRHARMRFRAFAAPEYDLTWVWRADTFQAFRPVLRGPVIVDLDDLEEYKLRSRLAVDRGGAGARRDARSPLRRLRLASGAALWRHRVSRIAREVERVVVCSDLDAARLGTANAAVIPNGYAPTVRPLGRTRVSDPPTLTFPGLLVYPPNADAAEVLVRGILPPLRRRVPGVQVRLVGTADGRVRRWHAPPGVVVTGFVESMLPELARADVIAVPLRFGGGTRIKLLEAFAHRIPVVSTSVGAEGLDAVDGVHLLVRDTPQSFADACALLLTDRATRASLADAARRLFIQKYRWDAIHPRVAALALEVARRVPAVETEAGAVGERP